jgi:UDP-glucose 4-epimerase
VNALVTGGAGFIGSTLVDRLLAGGHAVDVIDDLSTGSLANLADARADRSNQIRFHHADIRSPDITALIARRRPGVVFHLAAQPDAGVSMDRPAFDAEVNVVGTVNVLEGARAAGASKVVFASTQGPLSPHAVAKKAVVDYLHAYREIHALEFTALALSTVYGPRQRAGVIATFARQLSAGEPCTIFGDGGQTRDFLYVDDCVDALVRAAERGSGLVCDVGTGVETSVSALHRVMAGVMGVAERPVYAAGPSPEPPRAPIDPGRAAIYLGWKPWTSLEEGVRQILALSR